jgi:CRISPR/Cas system CSM-associated protein Csm5 (group 7 of RAMP superfamily)
MRYRLTCLTPLLVADGRKLSPIDYMVWKDHVNVLDQWRIFRLLAKGPRLEGYLTQLKLPRSSTSPPGADSRRTSPAGASPSRTWNEKAFFLQPEVRRSVGWPDSFNRAKLFESVNVYAAGLLALNRQYASWAGMGLLDKNLEELEQRLAKAREKGSCVLTVGWGGGLLSKSAWLDTTNADYRQILQQFSIYNRALSTNLPFPKTRRIVFLGNRPATLPGWAELSIE